MNFGNKNGPLEPKSVVHLISPNLNIPSSIESCDFDELSKDFNRWKDALHDDYKAVGSP